MRFRVVAILAVPAVFASACATGGARTGPVEVIRYNLGTPITPGSVAVDRGGPGLSTLASDYGRQVDAVANELGRLGFSRVQDGAGATYLLEVGVDRTQIGETRSGPRFGVGLGGGTGGFRGGGVGGGLSTQFGGSTRPVIGSELTVKLRRRSDSTVIWEGNARTQGSAPRDADTAALQADRLAAALFKDFPGQSGFTTTVP